MDLAQKFLQKAQGRRRKIGIVIMRPIPQTVESLRKASRYADLVVIGPSVIKEFECIVEPDQDKAADTLLTLLKEGKIEGIVRGQAKDSATLHAFYRKFGKPEIPSSRKLCPGILRKGDTTIVIGTCSIYHGISLEDKKYEADKLIAYMESLGMIPKIAVMATRRPTSIVGEYALIEEGWGRAEELVAYLVGKGYNAKNYWFEYETAVAEGCNLILCSYGIVGNCFFRALVYLGGWEVLASPYLDVGVVYEDGSRNETDFFWHIVHAVAMCNGGR